MSARASASTSKSSTKRGLQAPRRDELVIGRIVGVFGLRGEVKVAPAEPNAFVAGLNVRLRAGMGPARSLHIQHVRFHQRHALVQFRGVGEDGAARALQGADIFCSRRDLPKLPANAYRTADLVGLNVIDTHLGDLGVVSEVRHYPACDMLVIARGEKLVPLLAAYQTTIDVASGEIRVTLPDGFSEII